MRSSTAEEEAAFLQALGLLVVTFGALEDSLRDAILIGAGGQDQMIPMLTAGMAFRALIDKFGAMCVCTRPPLRTSADIQPLCNVLNAINDDRNRLVHATWTSSGPAGVPRRYKMSANARNGLRLNPQDVPVSDILALVSRIEDADRKIWEIVAAA